MGGGGPQRETLVAVNKAPGRAVDLGIEHDACGSGVPLRLRRAKRVDPHAYNALCRFFDDRRGWEQSQPRT